MATATVTPAARVPGPPELLPGRPDAIVDLQSDEGLALVSGEWRYSDARVEEVDFVELGSPADPLGRGRSPTAPTTCPLTPRPSTSTTPPGSHSHPPTQ